MYRYNNYFNEFKRLIVFKIEKKKKKKRVKTFVFIGENFGMRKERVVYFHFGKIRNVSLYYIQI